MMTPLGSAGGSQERVRVVAVEVAVGTVRIPGATKKRFIIQVPNQYVFDIPSCLVLTTIETSSPMLPSS